MFREGSNVAIRILDNIAVEAAGLAYKELHFIAERLRKDGVDAALLNYDGQIHGFLSVTRAIPEGDACTRKIADWLKAAW